LTTKAKIKKALLKAKERLPEVVFETFKEEMEKGHHKNAFETAEDFKWLFPEHELLNQIKDICEEHFVSLVMEGKYRLAEDYANFFLSDHEISITFHKNGTGTLKVIISDRKQPNKDIQTAEKICPWCGAEIVPQEKQAETVCYVCGRIIAFQKKLT
jgi:hypothetical protein